MEKIDIYEHSILGKDEKIIELQEFLNAILKNAKNSKSLLTYQNVIDIKKIVDELKKLEERNITSKNFIHKANSFKKHFKALARDFGFKTHRISLPFNRPTDLKIKLDNLLVSYGLNDEQITDLTKELLVTDARRPKEKSIEPVKLSYLNNDDILCTKKRKHITPLANEESNKKIETSTYDDIIDVRIEIEITRGEFKILENYIKKEYEDTYCGSPKLYLEDITRSIIEQIKQTHVM